MRASTVTVPSLPRFFGCVVLTAATAACGGRANAPASDTLAALPALHFEETALIGGASAEGPNALGSIVDGALLPGSDLLALIDGTTQEISYFTREGVHVRTIGGRGGGPGESQALRRIRGRRDGGLCSWDIQQRRITTFDAAGEVTTIGRTDTHVLEALMPNVVGLLDDCSYVVRDSRNGMGMHDEPEGMRRDTLRFLLFAPDGSLVDTIATVRDAEKWFRNQDGMWGEQELIFGDGLISFVSGRTLWLGITDSLRWTRVDLGTGASDTVRLQMSARSVSADQVQAERRRQLNAVEAPQRRGTVILDGRDAADVFVEAEKAAISAVPASTVAPAYDRAVPGGDGAIWLREFPMPSDTLARWALMTNAPHLDGQVTMPRSEEVIAASRDWLVALTKDTLDAPVARVLHRVGG